MKKILSFLLLPILLAGCRENKNDNSASYLKTSPVILSEAMLDEEPGDEVEYNEAAVIDPQRMVIKTIYIEIKTDNFDKEYERIAKIVQANKGIINSTTFNKNEKNARWGEISLQVPSEKLDSVLNKVKNSSGEVTSEHVNSRDITTNYIDVAARLENKKKAEEQYRLFLQKAKTVAEMLQIEEALSDLRGTIESMERQAKYYKYQSAMATIAIKLYEPDSRDNEEDKGFFTVIAESLSKGIDGFMWMMGVVITFLITILPMLPILYLLWRLAKNILIKLRARRRTKAELA